MISRLKAVEKLKIVVNSHTLPFNKIALRAMCESLPLSFPSLMTNDKKDQAFNVGYDVGMTVILLSHSQSAKSKKDYEAYSSTVSALFGTGRPG